MVVELPFRWGGPRSRGRRWSVGLDVDARSVVAYGLGGQTGEMFEGLLTPDHGELPGLSLTRLTAVASKP
jgi:hypothetical protein